jgi:hypothetical protein
VKNKLLVLILLVGFSILSGVAFSVIAHPVEADSVVSGTSIKLSPFINIWLDDVDNYLPAVAYNSRHNEYMVIWYNDRGPTRDIYARRIRADGTLLSSFTVTHNLNFWNYDPDIAYSPIHDEYLVVWTYKSSLTGTDIWARRVSWDGSWLGSEFAIGRPDKSGDQASPAVAYNDQADEYLVVYENRWGGTRDIDAQRVRASDGAVLSWRNIATGSGSLRHHSDVAYSPASNSYLITYWYQPSSSVDPGDVLGKLASSNLVHLSGEINICVDTNNQKFPTVAASTGEFLVAWEDSPHFTATGIYARRIASDGTLLGPSGGFWITGITDQHNGSPVVASGSASGYLITWYRRMGASNWDVFARLVRPGHDSGFNSEFAVDNDVGVQWDPVAACSTIGDCLVVEEDNNSAGNDFEIRGRLVMFEKVFLPLSVKGY